MRRPAPNKMPRRLRDPLFPACDSQTVPNPLPKDELWGIKLQFLDAYYQINRAHAHLAALAQRQHSRPSDPEHRRRVRAVERAIAAKDALEDRYAARGLVASPMYVQGFARDVRFQTGQGPAYTILSSASVMLTFRMPDPRGRRK